MDNLNLYKKMYAVMAESMALDKSMTVGKGNNSYKAISEASVLNLMKPLLKKHKLILFPIDATIEETVNSYPDQYDSSKTKTRLISQVVAKYKIVDIETGESEVLASVGNGADPQDKGSGKAWTYAYKALLQKTFMLFSGEDTDNTHSDDVMPSATSDNVTTKMLHDAIVKYGKDDAWAIGNYNDQHGKSISDLKFMSQESKKGVYHYLLAKLK